MDEPARRPGVSIVVGLLGLAAAVGAAALLWYLPVPRQWWWLVLFFVVPGSLVVLSGVSLARGLRQQVQPGQAPDRP